MLNFGFCEFSLADFVLHSQTPTPGTVYVTVKQHSAIYVRDVSYRHFEVDPWELSIVAPEPRLRVELLVLPIGA